MTHLLHLHHLTRYAYDRPVRLGPQIVRLRPAPASLPRVRHYALTVQPAEHFLKWQQDPFGNAVARLVFPERAAEFSLAVDLTADMTPINPFDFFVEPYAETWPFTLPQDLRDDWGKDLAPFLQPEPAGPLLRQFAGAVAASKGDTVDSLVNLNRRLRRMIRYLTRHESGVQTPEETLRTAAGSCRDTAWLFVQLLRHLAVPARFVSGYLIEPRADDAAPDAPAFTGALHAWAEVYLPGAGWIGLDPTSGLLCAENHVALAATRHYRAAAPITGSVEESDGRSSFAISVRAVAQSDAAALEEKHHARL